MKAVKNTGVGMALVVVLNGAPFLFRTVQVKQMFKWKNLPIVQQGFRLLRQRVNGRIKENRKVAILFSLIGMVILLAIT